jgi:hypothetical protein
MKLSPMSRMFISSLTITAVVLACVSFRVARVSATNTSTTSGVGTPMSQRGGRRHYHHQDQHTERSKDGVIGSSGGSGGHSIKIHNFISTDALYDGEQERRIHYNGVTAKETAVTTESAANSTRFVLFEVQGSGLESGEYGRGDPSR